MYRMGKEEIEAVARVIESRELFKATASTYKETENLERELCELLNVDYTISLTSGTAALTSALIGMGVGPGDEVIVPAYTYIATAFSVLATGAIPVVAEIDESLMLDAEDVEKKITPNTKVILPVHMKGYPADMDKLMAVAKKHNLMVLEDACQAVGGSYKGKRLGAIGDAGAFSFNYFKNISAGEGGAMFTSNRKIYEKGKIYHDSSAVSFFGNQMKDFTEEVFCGTEFRTNEITSAILRVQLTRLEGILADLRKNKKLLMKALDGHYKFIPSNDPEGECASAITFKFDSPEEAAEIAAKAKLSIPANVDKHVYCYWDALIAKNGAAHPLMNPYNMEANKNAPLFDKDSCKKSIEILSSCAHLDIHPDWSEETIKEIANRLIEARK